MILRPVGATAWLIDAERGDGRGSERAGALVAALQAAPPAGMLAARRGATAVLVTFVDRAHAGQARAQLAALDPPPHPRPPAREVVLEVVYQGEDLAPTAAALGRSVQALVAEHVATAWRAEFCGFAPGFAYLSGWSHRVPRRASPRTRVPAGSVGLADGWTAAYPGASPGGWQLIGHTATVLWDAERDPPGLIQSEDVVRMRQVRARSIGVAPASPRVEPTGPGLRVLVPGQLALVQDEGRPGQEHLGVSPSGAACAADARRATRAVGNHRSAAVLEWVGDLAVAAVGDQVVAVTGIRSAQVVVGDQVTAVASGSATALPHGAVLRATGRSGPAYLAARGGLDVPPVLGSRSRDVLGGIGPPPLAPGDLLPVGPASGVVGPAEPDALDEAAVVVRVAVGPRADWVDPASVALLCGQEWTVAVASRVGLRLAGARLVRVSDDELASEPMVAGAIQVPPDGEPVVLLRDHPVTGGYPVVAVVDPADLDLLGRLGPGDVVRFVRAELT